MVDPERTQMTL